MCHGPKQIASGRSRCQIFHPFFATGIKGCVADISARKRQAFDDVESRLERGQQDRRGQSRLFL